jgi:hypothetical protein
VVSANFHTTPVSKRNANEFTPPAARATATLGAPSCTTYTPWPQRFNTRRSRQHSLCHPARHNLSSASAPPTSAAMACNKYFHGDFSRYLNISDLGSYLLSSVSYEPEASRAPAVHDFLSSLAVVGGEHHQAPATVDVGSPRMPATEQAYGLHGEAPVQGSRAGGSSFINGMLTTTICCVCYLLLTTTIRNVIFLVILTENHTTHVHVPGSDQKQFQHHFIINSLQATGHSLYPHHE